MVYYNSESCKLGATKIPNECVWRKKWPVWGYVGIELAQSSYDFELSYVYTYSSIECIFIRLFMMQLNKYDAYLSYTCIILTIFFPLF